MKLNLTMSKEIKRLFKGLSSANVTLEAMQFFITEDFIDIGGIDAGRIKLSMIRVPFKTEKSLFEPICIDPHFFLKILGNVLDNEKITIEDYKRDKHNGVRIVCNDREFTFTEESSAPVIKPTSLDKIFQEKNKYCELNLEWKYWTYILKELNIMEFDTFDIYTKDKFLWINAESHYHTYKRKVISLSECKKSCDIEKATFALRNFDRNIYQPIRIQIAEDQPICLTFEHEGITLRQWIAPRVESDDF